MALHTPCCRKRVSMEEIGCPAGGQYLFWFLITNIFFRKRLVVVFPYIAVSSRACSHFESPECKIAFSPTSSLKLEAACLSRHAMPPLLRPRLVCHYCGERSKSKQKDAHRFKCEVCEAVNFLDEVCPQSPYTQPKLILMFDDTERRDCRCASHRDRVSTTVCPPYCPYRHFDY